MKSPLVAFLPALLSSTDVFTQLDWGTVSATGLLGWYLWYSTKVLMPRHEERITVMQQSCSEELRRQRDHYEGLLSELRGRHDERHREIVEVLDRISDKLDA